MNWPALTVTIDPWLAPDMFVAIDGKFRAGSAEAVDRLIEALRARPWWRKIIDECDAFDRAQWEVEKWAADVNRLMTSLQIPANKLYSPRWQYSAGFSNNIVKVEQ